MDGQTNYCECRGTNRSKIHLGRMIRTQEMKKGLYQVIGQLLAILLFTSASYADFGIMLGSFKSRDNAEKYVTEYLKNLNQEKYNIFLEKIQMPGKRLWYRACLGPYATRKDALNRKTALRAKGFSDNMILVKTRAQGVASTEKASFSDSEKETGTEKKTRDVTISWDAGSGPDISGYKIFYDTDPGPPYNPDPADYADEGPPPVIVGSDVTEITLHGLTDTKNYYFSITSFVSPEGPESGFSSEVTTLSKALPGDSLTAVRKEIETKKDVAAKKAEPREIEHTPPAAVQVEAVTLDQKEPNGLLADLSEAAEDPGLIASGDTIEIKVPGQAEMSRLYDVGPDGNLYMMTVGKISVQGLSVAALQRKLNQKLKKFIGKGDELSLRITASRRYMNIKGGVRYPGWYHVPSTTTLEGLIETAGGLLEGVNKSRILLRRETRDGHEEIRVKGKIVLHSNDILLIPIPDVYKTKVDSGDLLFINIPGKREKVSPYIEEILKRQQFEVDRNGYIYIPDIGHIYVNNLTTEEIKKIINNRLPKYLARDSKVQVSIIEKRQFVQVLGHVTNPGRYSVPEGGNVQAALNSAGGAVDGAIMSDASILRKMGEEIARIKVNLYQFTITGDPRLLTPLHEDDTLFVPISPNFGNVKRTLMPWTPPTERLEKDVKEKVRIFGGVHNPGVYEPKEGMTLLDLLIMASGETDDADLSKILIIRENKVDVVYNLQQFLNMESTEPIPKIHNGDTVYVKFRELTIFEPAEDKVFFVLGEVRSPDEYKLYDNMTVFQAIAMAGGLTEWADEGNITLIRTVNGKQENFHFNFNKAIVGQVPERNVYVQPNDTIYVP